MSKFTAKKIIRAYHKGDIKPLRRQANKMRMPWFTALIWARFAAGQI